MNFLLRIIDCLPRRRFDVGRRGEMAARRYLKSKGYRILGHNICTQAGEVDLLMQTPDGRTLVIVEVKSTAAGDSTRDELRPEVRVGMGKQRQLVKLASQLARRRAYRDQSIRFDVVGVDFPVKGKPAIRHHEGAFESFL